MKISRLCLLWNVCVRGGVENGCDALYGGAGGSGAQLGLVPDSSHLYSCPVVH